MSPTAFEISFPLSIIILSFIATGVLVVIMMLLFTINSKLSEFPAKTKRREPANNNVETPEVDESKDEDEVPAGTQFEEFLNEDPERLKLTKKEKFKAYRAWRSEKGLNWKK